MFAIWLLLITCTAIGQDAYSSDTTYVDSTTVSQYSEDPPVAVDDESSTDTSHKYRRMYMSEERLAALRNKREFQYPDIDSAKPVIQQEVREPSSFKGFDISFLLWIVAAVALCIIILQFAGLNMRQVFTPRKPAKRSSETDLDNIHEIPYEEAISNAIAAGNFSLAVRLLYLQSLKLLSDKALIKWQPNKTNWQYVNELSDNNLRRRFTSMTSIFEYVRYGSMPLTAPQFHTVRQSFDAFNQQVI